MEANYSTLIWCGDYLAKECAYGWRVYRDSDDARVYAMYTGSSAERQDVRTWYAYSVTTLPARASRDALAALISLS